MSTDVKEPTNSGIARETDLDEFRPVAMVTRRVAEDGSELIRSNIANLKVGQDSGKFEINAYMETLVELHCRNMRLVWLYMSARGFINHGIVGFNCLSFKIFHFLH